MADLLLNRVVVMYEYDTSDYVRFSAVKSLYRLFVSSGFCISASLPEIKRWNGMEWNYNLQAGLTNMWVLRANAICKMRCAIWPLLSSGLVWG